MKQNYRYFLFFVAVSCAYFYEFIPGGVIPVHEDIIKYFYPAMAHIQESYRSGALPLWNKQAFSGFPLLASPQAAALYPPTVFSLILLPLDWAFNLDIIVHSALGGFFTFLYVRRLGGGVFPALMAGVLFAFMGYRIRFLGHVSVFHASTWIPAILYCYEGLRKEPTLRNMALAGIAVAFQVYSGHPQICFYTYMVIAFFLLFYASSVESGKRKAFLATGIGALGLGLLMAAPQLYASYELSSVSVRSSMLYQDFASYSFPPDNLSGFLFPSLHTRPVEGYMGQLPLFLALVGTAIAWRRNFHMRFWGLLALLSLVLSFGGFVPALHKLMYHLPIYQSFRSPSRHLIEYGLAVSVLFAFSLSFILESGQRSAARKVLLWVLVLSGVAVITPPAVFAFTGNGKGAVFSLIAAVAFVLVLWSTEVWRSPRVKYAVAVLVLLEVAAFHNVQRVNIDELKDQRKETFTYLSEHPGRTAFFTDEDRDRLSWLYGINTMGGYDSLITDDFNILFEMGGTGHPPTQWRRLLEGNCLLSMFNVRYLVVPPKMSIALQEEDNYELLSAGTGYRLYENRSSLPLAWPVQRLVSYTGIADVKEAMYDCSMNPGYEAAVQEDDMKKIGFPVMLSNGKVRLVEHHNGRIVLNTDFPGSGFVVVAEQYYPGWKARVDKTPVSIYQTNGVLRGVIVPPGSHELVMYYQPTILYLLMGMSALVFAFTAVLIYRRR